MRLLHAYDYPRESPIAGASFGDEENKFIDLQQAVGFLAPQIDGIESQHDHEAVVRTADDGSVTVGMCTSLETGGILSASIRLEPRSARVATHWRLDQQPSQSPAQLRFSLKEAEQLTLLGMAANDKLHHCPAGLAITQGNHFLALTQEKGHYRAVRQQDTLNIYTPFHVAGMTRFHSHTNILSFGFYPTQIALHHD